MFWSAYQVAGQIADAGCAQHGLFAVKLGLQKCKGQRDAVAASRSQRVKQNAPQPDHARTKAQALCDVAAAHHATVNEHRRRRGGVLQAGERGNCAVDLATAMV